MIISGFIGVLLENASLKKNILLLFLLLLPSVALADESVLPQPHWSLELKGGLFVPDLNNFSYYYDRSNTAVYGASLAYKILPQVEVGAGARYSEAKGQGFEELHANLTSSVTYELIPVDVFVLYRAVVVEDQWVIPYVGGGWTRMLYREKVDAQPTATGHADGFHVRGGLQLSLDNLDQEASRAMYENYGVIHTSVFFEAEYTRAIESSTSVDLGGMSYLGGLLFEF